MTDNCLEKTHSCLSSIEIVAKLTNTISNVNKKMERQGQMTEWKDEGSGSQHIHIRAECSQLLWISSAFACKLSPSFTSLWTTSRMGVYKLNNSDPCVQSLTHIWFWEKTAAAAKANSQILPIPRHSFIRGAF